MKKMIVFVAALLLACCGVLLSLAPDTLSIVILLVMCFFVGLGFFLGLMPTLLFSAGFRNARWNLSRAVQVQSTETWIAVFKVDQLFGHKILDGLFREYKTKIRRQREAGEVLTDVEDHISEDVLGLRTWQGLVVQIPGTLTGLGLLGTFIGLIMGISTISFSSVHVALESVVTLLRGIETAYYTSVSGVILSILFNISNRISWNTMLREYGLFVEDFHKLVIPTAQEQSRSRRNQDMKKILERLERLPRALPYSFDGAGDGSVNEQILMPRIVQGLKNGEFTFYLWPEQELSTRAMTRAEAVLRWEHDAMGPQPMEPFLPMLERNGYITRLNSFVWEEVCRTIRRWKDFGIRPMPVAVKLSRTDLMATDVAGFFNTMVERYQIPARALELEIAQSTFLQSAGTANEVAGALRRMGFKVILDEFDGDFVALDMLKGMEVDALKLDLTRLGAYRLDDLYAIFDNARVLNVELTVSGVETAEQLAELKRAGCQVGQGVYFGGAVDVHEFETLSGRE